MNDFISNALLNIEKMETLRNLGVKVDLLAETNTIEDLVNKTIRQLKKENKDKLLVLAKGKFPPSTYNKIAILVKKYA